MNQKNIVSIGTILIGLLGCNDQPTESTQTPPPAEPSRVSESATTTATVTVAAAGDIAACSSSNQSGATARLVDEIPGTVLTLGDNAYPDGTTANFRCYNATWGRFKSRTRPSPGNHEYHTSGAGPYFAYFGSRAGPSGRGYYSFNLGSWHLVSLNSERSLSAQASWLKNDLATHRTKCTLAYWHRPLFTSGVNHSPATDMRPLFTILYNAGAEIVLSGHNHQYERFAPQTPWGNANSSRGIVQFVAGTGGAGLYSFSTPMRNSVARYRGYGVIQLTLRSGSYDFSFISISGAKKDGGSRVCH